MHIAAAAQDRRSTRTESEIRIVILLSDAFIFGRVPYRILKGAASHRSAAS
jgi:hypothetical protein